MIFSFSGEQPAAMHSNNSATIMPSRNYIFFTIFYFFIYETFNFAIPYHCWSHDYNFLLFYFCKRIWDFNSLVKIITDFIFECKWKWKYMPNFALKIQIDLLLLVNKVNIYSLFE